MEEEETVSILSRKELRKQKLMEYLARKEKVNLPNPQANLHVNCPVKMPVTAPTAVKGKENKVPADRFGYKATNVKSLAAESTKCPTTASSGVANKVNVKRSILEKQKNDSCPTAVKGSAQPNKNSVPRSRYAVISSTSNLNGSKHVKKQPNAEITYSSQNVVNTAALTTIRFTRKSSATLSVPVKTVSARMSHVPIVKTKTGLISAVIQPRSTNSHLIRPSATAPVSITTSGSVNRAISRPSSSVSVSQRSTVVQRKTISTAVANNPIKRTTVSLASRSCKFEHQSKLNLKSHLAKPSQSSCKSQISSGLKSAPLSSKCRAANIKPERNVGMSTTNRSAGQHTDRSTTSGKGEKTDSLLKVTSQTSSGPSTRCSSRGVGGAPVAEPVGETTKCKAMQNKKGHSSANVRSQKPTTKRTDALIKSKAVPQPARTFSMTGKPTEMKTPKVVARVIPQAEGKKLTAAQEERMRKLQEWKEAKGISYKRPPMPVKPRVRRTVAVPQPFWTAMNEEDEAHSLISAVDRSLADCIKLLEERCPPDQVKEVLARLPVVSQKFAKYWICQARLMEQEGNLDVLPMFKEAVRVVLEPVDELRTVVFEILKKKDEIQASEEKEKDMHEMPANDSPDESCNNPMTTPKPVRALICGEKGNSSVVKYKITATPGGSLSQMKEPVRVDGQEVCFFTPVRRSVRIERASFRYPASLQDHDLCVASYNDLISEEDKENIQEQNSGETSLPANGTPMYIYRQNEALKDKVFVQLVCDD